MQYLWAILWAILIYFGVAVGIKLIMLRPNNWDGLKEEARLLLYALRWPLLAFPMIFDPLASGSERLAVFLLWAGGGIGLYLNLCPPVPPVWFWVSYFLAFFAVLLWAVVAKIWSSLRGKLKGKRKP